MAFGRRVLAGTGVIARGPNAARIAGNGSCPRGQGLIGHRVQSPRGLGILQARGSTFGNTPGGACRSIGIYARVGHLRGSGIGAGTSRRMLSIRVVRTLLRLLPY